MLRTRYYLAAALGLLLLACGPPDSDGPLLLGTGKGEATARGVAAVTTADVVSVEDTRLVFPRGYISNELRKKIDAFETAMQHGQPRDSVENVIMVEGRGADAVDGASKRVNEQAANPYGFIRRALSIRDEGDVTIIETEQATLAEMFDEWSRNGIIQTSDKKRLRYLDATPRSLEPCIRPIVDLSGKALYAGDALSIRIRKGSLTLSPLVRSSVDLNGLRLTGAHVDFRMSVRADIAVEASIDGQLFEPLTTEMTLFSGKYAAGMLGPVPITAAVTIGTKCRLSAEGKISIAAGVSAETTLSAKIDYQSGSGADAALQLPAPTWTPIPPQVQLSARSSVSCQLEARVDLLFFDVIGPFVAPYVTSTAEIAGVPVEAVLRAGMGAHLGGSFQIFSKEIVGFEKTAFDAERELWRGTF